MLIAPGGPWLDGRCSAVSDATKDCLLRAFSVSEVWLERRQDRMHSTALC